jgi:hypothetical protein
LAYYADSPQRDRGSSEHERCAVGLSKMTRSEVLPGPTIESVIRRYRCFELGKIVSKMPIHSTSGVVSVLQGVFLFVANFDNYATKFSRNVHNAPLWGQIRRMKSRRGSANGAALR